MDFRSWQETHLLEHNVLLAEILWHVSGRSWGAGLVNYTIGGTKPACFSHLRTPKRRLCCLILQRTRACA